MNQSINVLKNKNYQLLFWGVNVTNFAHILFNFAISFYVLNIGAEIFGVARAALVQALYLAVSGLLLVILVPFGGVIADRFNKAKIMMVTDLIRGVTIIVIGVITVIFTNPLVILILLFILNIILATQQALFNPASASLLRFIVTDQELTQGASYLQSSQQLQNIFGIIAGGIIYGLLGVFSIFMINGLAYIISGITEYFIKYDHPKSQQQLSLTSVFNEMIDGIKYIYYKKEIFNIILMALMINFFIAPLYSTGLPYFARFGIGESNNYLFSSFLSPEQWHATYSTASAIASLIMTLYLAVNFKRDNISLKLKKAVVLIALMTISISSFLISFYQGILNINLTLIGIVISMFITGFALISFNVPLSIVIQTKVEPKMLGKTSSVISSLSQSMIPVATIFAGFIISTFNPQVFYLLAIVGTSSVAIWFWFNRDVNRL
jgi:DHA3 family macrolide efflux protein-like MFS transporter